MLTYENICIQAAEKLKKQSGSDSLRMARDIFCLAAGIDKKELILKASEPIEKSLENVYASYLERFLNHEPLSRLSGYKNFYDFDFLISPFTLDPRPETEILINLLQEAYPQHQKKLKILDIGTGSGCLAVTAAKIYKNSEITALDICEKALIIAHANALRAGVENRVSFKHVKTTLCDTLHDIFDVILCNPPYIPEAAKHYLDISVSGYDPDIALYFGDNGLGFYEILADFCLQNLSPKGNLFIEFGIGQARCVKNIFSAKSAINFLAVKDNHEIFRAARVSYD